ncbi:MAG: MBL fold metallo-hydrolase [Deltaproteobacteria bacterium]|uniref:MBL fold metallo-hydrolase n=1 Tax=Candidatus Zymogenus saltonus TaxID=2844893 RepID=A0A9D8KDD5_9DELT|nr:MBL fold metallo-hydrolase [Candidatus Zymogenus saltonus]
MVSIEISIEKGVHTFTLPLLFPLNPVNVYFIPGEVPTLIDTGLDTEPAWEKLVSGIERLGFSMADVRRIILTHGHIDHMGLCGKIIGHVDAEVLIHPADEFRVTAGVEELVKMMEKNAHRFVSMGLSERDVDRIFRNYIKLMRRFYAPLSRCSFIEEGDEIDLGGFTLKVVGTPGHTGGSISLIDGKGVLFSGDHVMNGVATNPLPEMTADAGVGLVPYIESLKKVLGLEPRLIYPGHGDAIADPRDHVEKTLAFHDDLFARVESNIDDGWITPADLTSRIFPELAGIYASHVVFEVNGYLEALCVSGRAESREEGGLSRFRAV